MGTIDSRGRPRVQTVNDSPTRTVQSDQVHTDLALILDRYRDGVPLDVLNRAEARFVDISELSDYAEAMRVVRSAEGFFMSQDPKVRAIFGNSVANFLDAAHDPDKRELLVEAGFLEADPETSPAVEPPAPPPDPPED